MTSFSKYRISSITRRPRIEAAKKKRLTGQTQLSEFRRDSKMLDAIIQIIYFVSTNFQLKNIMNFNSSLLGVPLADLLRSDA